MCIRDRYKDLHISNGGATPELPTSWQDPDIAFLLKKLGFFNSFQSIAKHSGTNDVGFRRAMYEWFDGLKVVRFLNAARHFYPDEKLLPRAQQELGRPNHDAGALNRLSESQRRLCQHGIDLHIDH